MNVKTDVCNESGDGWGNLGAGRKGWKKEGSSMSGGEGGGGGGKQAKFTTERGQR